MRRTAGLTGLLAGIVLLAACGDDPTITQTRPAAEPPMLASSVSGADKDPVQLTPQDWQDLAALKRVTAPFHDFDAAKLAGYNFQITGCMTDPVAGGMGFHFAKPNVGLGDGTVRADQPQLLLYEPEKNGKLRLVAVEYTVPLGLWQSASPPRLFSHDFKPNAAVGIWALHAWVWEDNPAGMFKDWNPRVNCDKTSDIMAMVH
jgi:hypothetical protein